MINKLSAIVLILSLSTLAHASDYGNKSAMKKGFFKHCENPDLTKPQSETLELLFKRFRTDSCKGLHKKLTKWDYLIIEGKGISDVSIFRHVYGLKKLLLNRNNISDISSLEGLDKIEQLSLALNKISDIRPLLKMKSLKQVILYGNPIEKESANCPTDTHNESINDFCFDEKAFDQAFDSQPENNIYNLEDARQIISLIIDNPGLEIFYHADSLPERSPLKVYVDKLPSTHGFQITKFGKPVIFTGEPITIGLNTNLNIKGDYALAKFKYPPEGVFGSFKLKKDSGSWQIKKSKILE